MQLHSESLPCVPELQVSRMPVIERIIVRNETKQDNKLTIDQPTHTIPILQVEMLVQWLSLRVYTKASITSASVDRLLLLRIGAASTSHSAEDIILDLPALPNSE